MTHEDRVVSRREGAHVFDGVEDGEVAAFAHDHRPSDPMAEIATIHQARRTGNSTQLWLNRTGRLSPLSAPDRCIDRSGHSGGDPSPPPPLPAFRNVSLGARARAVIQKLRESSEILPSS